MQAIIPREVYNELSTQEREKLFDYLTFIGISVEERPIYIMSRYAAYEIAHNKAQKMVSVGLKEKSHEILSAEDVQRIVSYML